MHGTLIKKIAILSLVITSLYAPSAHAQAKVELKVPKLEFINGNTCQIFIEAINAGDRQITMAIDFRINAKNGDLITTSARVFELRKGKSVVSSVYAKDEKCTDIGSLAVQNIVTCSVEGSVIGNTAICEKVIFPQSGKIPIKK